MRNVKAVTVFCSASQVADEFMKPAVEVAKMIGGNGWNFIWGGSDYGMMSDMSTAAQEAGSKLIGFSVEHFAYKAKKSADEMHISKTTAERRKLMIDRGDVIVVMPGGVGTLDEMTDAIEARKFDLIDSSIIILNYHGFFDGLKAQIEHMAELGFLHKEYVDYVTFVETPEAVINAVKAEFSK